MHRLMRVLMSLAGISWVERVEHVGRALWGTESSFEWKACVQREISVAFRNLVNGYGRLLVSVQLLTAR